MSHRGISYAVLPLFCHVARKAQESPAGGIVVIRQRHCTERYSGRITRNRTKLHLRKLSRDRGLAGEAHAEAQRNKMHQGLTADVEPLYPRTITKLRETRDQAVMDGPTQFGLAQNHLLITKGLPCDLIAIAEHVSLRQRSKYVFGPQLCNIAVRQIRSPDNEGNVQAAFANKRNLLARCALQDV